MNRALSIGLCIAGFVVLLLVGINKYIKLKEQNEHLKADNLNLLRYHIEESNKPGKVEESLLIV